MNILAKYFEEKFDLSPIEKAKLNFSLNLLYAELSKSAILITIFSILGQGWEFICANVALFFIRPITGGLHFKTYKGCLFFTLTFFSVALFLYNKISLKSYGSYLLLLSAIITLIYAPINNPNRPKHSREKKRKLKGIGLVVIFVHFILYKGLTPNMYLDMSTWVFALQALQLLLKKGGWIFEKR